MRKVVKLLLCIGLLSSCHNRQVLPPAAYIDKMERDYSRNISSGKIEYNIQLATPELMVCKELDGMPGANIEQYIKRMKDLKGYIFFVIKIKSANNKAMASEMVMYYEQAATKDIRLLENGITDIPAVWNFENNYGLTPYNAIVVGFKQPSNMKKDLQLVFNDNYTHTPMIKASFSERDLNSLPQLSIN